MRRLDAKRALAVAIVLAALAVAVAAAIRAGYGPSADRRVVLSGSTVEGPGLEPVAVGIDKSSGAYKLLVRDSGGQVYEIDVGGQGGAHRPAESP